PAGSSAASRFGSGPDPRRAGTEVAPLPVASFPHTPGGCPGRRGPWQKLIRRAPSCPTPARRTFLTAPRARPLTASSRLWTAAVPGGRDDVRRPQARAVGRGRLRGALGVDGSLLDAAVPEAGSA